MPLFGYQCRVIGVHLPRFLVEADKFIPGEQVGSAILTPDHRCIDFRDILESIVADRPRAILDEIVSVKHPVLVAAENDDHAVWTLVDRVDFLHFRTQGREDLAEQNRIAGLDAIPLVQPPDVLVFEDENFSAQQADCIESKVREAEIRNGRRCCRRWYHRWEGIANLPRQIEWIATNDSRRSTETRLVFRNRFIVAVEGGACFWDGRLIRLHRLYSCMHRIPQRGMSAFIAVRVRRLICLRCLARFGCRRIDSISISIEDFNNLGRIQVRVSTSTKTKSKLTYCTARTSPLCHRS